MNRVRLSLILIGFILIPAIGSAQCEYGDPCMVADADCLDTNYSEINEFISAGVTGGIPSITNIQQILNPGDNIQTAINNANSAGGGVVLLNAGTYNITTTINMKSNVVLRGVDSASVILESTIRSTWAQGKKNTIYFNNVSNSGLENLTIYYRVDGNNPIDRVGMNNGGYCDSCFQNDPHGATDLYVRQVEINVGSSNCWLDACKILRSGTDPVYVRGNHNTMRNCFVDQAYNKGGSGNGYIDVRGDYNLFVGNTIKRIRHFAPQLGAQFNVVFNNHLEVDVNFHNGDAGNNLIEQNTILIPTWRGWDVFSVGVSGQHAPPGPDNIMVNNITDYRWFGPRYNVQDSIYTLIGFQTPTATGWEMPPCGTFYPMIESFTALPIEWLSFEASLLNNQHVHLEWSLSSQTNNDFFTVERSENGIEWFELAILDGAGSISEISKYDFHDQHPTNGLNYYRIKQTDYDGKTSYSDNKTVLINPSEIIVVYPNPAKDYFIVEVRELNESCFSISNALGQKIFLEYSQLSNGNIRFESNDLHRGVNFITINNNSESTVFKLILE